MKILYLDLDAVRPDHLGCYGYKTTTGRDTSPNLDLLAARGARFDQVYATDVPCLPSRSALFSGQCGYRTGVINHGGVAAQPFIEGPKRQFRDRFGTQGWMACLRRAGLHTATISPFGERHSAWHWLAGWNEIHNTGGCGMEDADEVSPVVLDWIERNGRRENWFLHVNYWDAHTPYRAPDALVESFGDCDLPAWLTEEVRQRHWNGCGPHSAQEVNGFEAHAPHFARFPHQPLQIASMDAVRAMFDGYDAGIRHADNHVGRVLNALADAGVLDETLVIVSSDHGENLGELNIYGDHQTADAITTHVPLILSGPQIETPTVDTALRYHMDFAAKIIEMAGQDVPDDWDGASFEIGDAGRDFLVVSQGAWSCQRGVRWNEGARAFHAVRSYHDGYHGFPEWMVFDLNADPHEQHDLSAQAPELVGKAAQMLDEWRTQMARLSQSGHDPMDTVLNEGGALHTRGQLPSYLERLRATGRTSWAEHLAARYPAEARSVL